MSEPDLPEGWPDAFDEDARDYLYEEASTRLRESIEFGNQQLDKALALLRISLLVIAAGGIFGDLYLGLSVRGVLSALAVGSALLVGSMALLLLYPRSWETGANVEWLARWSGATSAPCGTQYSKRRSKASRPTGGSLSSEARFSYCSSLQSWSRRCSSCSFR